MTFYKHINNKIKLIYHKAIKLEYYNMNRLYQYNILYRLQIYKIKATKYLSFTSLSKQT